MQYVQVCSVKGRKYGYYRRAGVRQRIAGEIGSPEFIAAYQAIHAAYVARQPGQGITPLLPGSLRALWMAYKSSAEWKRLGPGTQTGYAQLIQPLLEDWGNEPVKLLPPEWVQQRMDELAETPSRANHFLAVLRLLLNWSIPRGWITNNPTTGIKRARHTAVPHRIWTDAEIAAMTGPEAASIAREVMIGLDTAQRLGDVLRLPWSAYDGEAITVTAQGKTGVRVRVPISPDLRAVLDQADRTAVVICTRRDGHAWKIDHFKHEFAKVRARLGLPPDLHFHGLRHTAAARLAQAGCSPHEIAAVTGHKSLSMVSRYTQQVGQDGLATAAIARLGGQKKNKTVKPPRRKV